MKNVGAFIFYISLYDSQWLDNKKKNRNFIINLVFGVPKRFCPTSLIDVKVF